MQGYTLRIMELQEEYLLSQPATLTVVEPVGIY